MLGDKDAAVTIAVKDLKVAKGFYEGTLGLKRIGAEDPDGLFYKSGNSQVFIYESRFAGTNKATAASWVVGDDVEGVVRALKARGVVFEQYDLPDTTREGDVHVTGDRRAAWFKDPDGNILAIVSR